MGGLGSGRPRLSDEEKATRERPGKPGAVLDAEKAARLIPGPWLNEIPPPQMPLNEVGRSKYDELTRQLFDQGKLNATARDIAEVAALTWQGFHALASEGKTPNASALKQFNHSIGLLNLQRNAAPIAGHDRPKKFARSGFANRIAPKTG